MFSWQNKIFTHPLEILTNTVIIHRYLNSAIGPKLSHKGKVPGRSVLSWLSFGCQLCCGHCYSWNMSFSSSGSFIFPKTKIRGWGLASTDNSHWFLDIGPCCPYNNPLAQVWIGHFPMNPTWLTLEHRKHAEPQGTKFPKKYLGPKCVTNLTSRW